MNAPFRTLLLIFLFAFMIPIHAAKWDLEYWQYVRWVNWKSDQARFSTVAKFRFRDTMSDFYSFRIGEEFRYLLLPCLDVGAAFSYIYYKPFGCDHFKHKTRLDLEVNPFYILRNGMGLFWRNRFEFFQGTHEKVHTTFRHRFLISVPFQRAGRLLAVYFSDEVFYSISHNKFVENRFMPLNLELDSGWNTTINLFVLIRSFLSEHKWYRTSVVGATFAF